MTDSPPLNTPQTHAQPTRVNSRANSFFPVTGSFHKTADRSTTKEGAVYSKMEAAASEQSYWQEK